MIPIYVCGYVDGSVANVCLRDEVSLSILFFCLLIIDNCFLFMVSRLR